MNLKLFLVSLFLAVAVLLPNDSIASSFIVSPAISLLETDSINGKKDFKKITKFISDLFEKKAIKKVIVKKIIAARKDTSHNSSYINDFKKYREIADSLSVDLIHEWDSVHNIKDVDYYSASDTVHKVVYGFHPYWMGSSYESYDYDLLTDIAFFSFELNARTGLFKTTHKWDDNDILDSAQKHGCKMHITISNFTQHNNKRFLKSQKSIERNIKEVIAAVTVHDRGIDGVLLDFENVPHSVKDELTQYVKDLSIALKKHGKVLSITVPAIDGPNTFDIEGMEDYVEYFLLMGYDYYGAWSTEAGPVAPFHSESLWGSYSVEGSIDDYLTRGMAPDQLVLVVPYYGGSWKVNDVELPSSKKKFNKSVTYREVRKKYAKETRILEPTSKTAYFNIKAGGGTNQIWFDNAEALSYKYDYVISEELAGVGIWALGYDNGYTDLWQLIEQKFGNVEIAADSVSANLITYIDSSSTSNIDSTSYIDSSSTLDVDRSSTSDKDFSLQGLYEIFFEKGDFLVRVALTVIFWILFLGFLLSLRRKGMREIVFQKSLITLIFLLILPGCCIYIILTTPYTERGFILLMGLLVGYGTYFIKEQTQFKSKKRIP